MSVRRSRRTAAAAAETRIARAVEEDSDDSNGSDFAKNLSSSSSDDNASSGNASDNDFVSDNHVRQYGNKGKKSRPTNSPAKRPSVPQQILPKPPTNGAEPAAPPTNSVVTSPASAPPAAKDLTDESLKGMLRSFRLTDLQALMIFVGKNKAGRKTELLVRHYAQHSRA